MKIKEDLQVLSPAPLRMSLIPGMSVEEGGNEEKRNFKPWELQESGRRLDNVFSWKVLKSPKLSEAEKAERRRLRKELEAGQTDGAKAKAAGEAEEGAGKEDQSRRGKSQRLSARCCSERREAAKMAQPRMVSKGPPQLNRKGAVLPGRCPVR